MAIADPFGLFKEEQEICAGLHLPTVDEEDARKRGQRQGGPASSATSAVVSSLKGMFLGGRKVRNDGLWKRCTMRVALCHKGC